MRREPSHFKMSYFFSHEIVTRGPLKSRNCTRKRLAAGLCLDPLGSLSAPPEPPSRNMGPTSKGRGRGEMGRGGREEEGGGRERWSPHFLLRVYAPVEYIVLCAILSYPLQLTVTTTSKLEDGHLIEVQTQYVFALCDPVTLTFQSQNHISCRISQGYSLYQV